MPTAGKSRFLASNQGKWSIRPAAATPTGRACSTAWPPGSTGRLASLLGALKIAKRGGQNHHFTRDEIAQRFKENFGTRIW